MIIFTFKRYIRAEVVTYRLDVVLGSLHAQQLHCFDELRDDQGIIQNRRVKPDKMAESLYLLSSHSSFRFLRLTKKIERTKILFFGRSDGGQEHPNKDIPRTIRQILTSGTCGIDSRVNCMCGSRDFLF
jgi:hypothetical protein